jgi:uncharacterized protein (DUF58 family)
MAVLPRRQKAAPAALPSSGFGGKLGVDDATPSRLSRLSRSVGGRIDTLRDDLETGAFGIRLQEAVAKLGLTRAGAAAVVSFVLLWTAARIVAGTAIYLFAYGLLLAVIAAIALARSGRLKLVATREGLFPRTTEGQRLGVTLQLTAKRRASTLVLEEKLPQRLGQTVRVPVARIGSGQVIQHQYTLRCQRRGVYKVGPLTAVSSDPLGLATSRTVVAPEFELLVHPDIENLQDRPLTRQFEEPPVRPPISRPWPSGLEFFGMREYSRGDDLRRIVWRASARSGKLMVREAEQGVTDKVVILLDTDRGGHSRDGDGVSESFEAGVRTAASLATFHLAQGFTIKLEGNDGPLTSPLRGVASQLQLMDTYARVDTGRTPLVTTLSRMAANPPRDAHVVVITPRLGPAEAARLRLIVRTGASVLVVALIWDEDAVGIPALATELGCQVSAVRPGTALAADLAAELGAGMQG